MIMGRKAYDKCIELMKQVKRDGYELEISANSLTLFIKRLIGSDDRTVIQCIDNLITFEFIEKQGNGVFIIKKKTITKELY